VCRLCYAESANNQTLSSYLLVKNFKAITGCSGAYLPEHESLIYESIGSLLSKEVLRQEVIYGLPFTDYMTRTKIESLEFTFSSHASQTCIKRMELGYSKGGYGSLSDRLYCAAKLHARIAHPLRRALHNYKAKLQELSIHELTF
jgi:hypothetical protein